LASWEEWSPCNSDSTEAEKSERYRDDCSDISSGFYCEREVDDYEERSCFIDGSPGSWTQWSSCDITDGTMQRSRVCERPQNIDADDTRNHICDEVLEEIDDCDAHELHCGTNGILKSHNYPQTYGNNRVDEEYITVPANSQLDLIIELSGIEYGQNCEFDFLEVIEVATGKSLLGKLCGDVTRRVHINTNEVKVIFQSDANVGGSGWKIEWCAPQVVTSPGWPNTYGNNQDTSVKIVADADKIIKLEFLEFDIEGSSGDCNYDWVKIVDGDGTEILSKSCGNNLESGTQDDPLYSETNVAYVFFHSDSFARRRGFMLHWVQNEA